jgi:hypothetical protein
VPHRPAAYRSRTRLVKPNALTSQPIAALGPGAIDKTWPI